MYVLLQHLGFEFATGVVYIINYSNHKSWSKYVEYVVQHSSYWQDVQVYRLSTNNLLNVYTDGVAVSGLVKKNNMDGLLLFWRMIIVQHYTVMMRMRVEMKQMRWCMSYLLTMYTQTTAMTMTAVLAMMKI